LATPIPKTAERNGRAECGTIATAAQRATDVAIWRLTRCKCIFIPARRYAVKPMTAEEAALRLSDAADQFLVFRDADTSRLGVIYKRNDGNYGLIEP